MPTETEQLETASRIRRALGLIADALNDNIPLKIALQSLPILWSTFIVQVFHDRLYDANTSSLNKVGTVAAALVFTISLLAIVLTAVKTQRDRARESTLRNSVRSCSKEIELRKTIAEADFMLETQRNRHFREAASSLQPSEDVRSFVGGAMCPGDRISAALDELGNCFSSVSNIARTDFTLSGAIAISTRYAKPRSTKWEWVHRPTMEGTASIDELTRNKSAFTIVASGKTFFYANDKQEAAKRGEYYLDGRDKTYGGGSIVCAEVDEEIGKWRMRLIVSISTYGRKIVESGKGGDEVSRQTLRTVYE